MRYSAEERTLLNPAFCSILLWAAAKGHREEGPNALSFEESFLVLPLVLHRGTREALPTKINSSLAAWTEANPLQRGLVARSARSLVPFTRDALRFGGAHGLITLASTHLEPNLGWTSAVSKACKDGSVEVEECAKRAEFLGRWLARSGTPATVFAILGVRP